MEDQIQIRILPEYINAGRPCDPDRCPIAIAFTNVAQAINPTWQVQVGPQNTYIVKSLSKDPEDYETIISFQNSPLIQNWIAMFDDYKTLPITGQIAPTPTNFIANFKDQTIKLVGEC